MGTDLKLVVPDDRKKDRKILDDYCSFVNKKEKKLKPDIPKEHYFSSIKYRIVREELQKGEDLNITDRIYTQVNNVLDFGDIYELFGNYYSVETADLYGDKIKKLIQILRKAKKELISNSDKADSDWEDWNYTMETQLIALCEFALENDYGIHLIEG